jgi:predicted helicase
MQEIKRQALTYKYQNELHCNEVMLLPYYIASMNMEHEFFERIGEYKPFEGICLVDTFETAEPEQGELFTTKNTERVERQKKSPIFVILGNPPYNANQLNENDNNKNRKYPVMDKRVQDTYVKDSRATLRNKLSDPYVKAIRWASDRIGEDGIVAFVSNNSFVDQIAFDGVRKHLFQDYDLIYTLDLGGNVRKNTKLSGSTHNVFGIQIGVSINFFVRKHRSGERSAKVHYSRVDEFWRKEQKYDFLQKSVSLGSVKWNLLKPDEKNTWLTEGLDRHFGEFIPLGSLEAKQSNQDLSGVIFRLFTLGVATNRDEWVYSFQPNNLKERVATFIEVYSSFLDKYERSDTKQIENLIDVSDGRIKWTRQVKASLKNLKKSVFDASKFRYCNYRPFTKKYLYFDDFWNEEQYRLLSVFPTIGSEKENRAISVSGIAGNKPLQCLMISAIADLHFTGDSQCFPFYTYDEDGSNRRENITDWAVEEFNKRYASVGGTKNQRQAERSRSLSKAKSRMTPFDSAQGDVDARGRITKWDIFHYIYAVLHHPMYREKYAANLRRELPRIPFVKDFWAFAEAGKKLATLHVEYEKQKEYKLEVVESKVGHLNYRVEKMKLSKDKKTLTYNDFFTLGGIPKEAFEYRLGNRSALEWIIDQYQVSTDKRSGITNDPNRTDDPEYIMRLVGQVITVSVETVKIVKALPEFKVETS